MASKRYLACILNHSKAIRDAKSAVATILLLKTYRKWFSWYHLLCSFEISVNVIAFLYVKANSKEICEEISFPSFFRKMLVSEFLLTFISKNAWRPQFFFVDSNSPCKDLLFPCGPSLAQKSLYLVGTVLN